MVGAGVAARGAAMDRDGPRIEHEDWGVWLSNTEGTLEWASPQAARLLKLPRELPRGCPCWQLVRVQTADGRPLCRRHCPLMRDAREGRSEQCREVRFISDRGHVETADLISYSIPARADRKRYRILHLMRRREIVSASRPGARRLNRLSSREREVLRLLAAGMGTHDVAECLFISPVTVRRPLLCVATSTVA